MTGVQTCALPISPDEDKSLADSKALIPVLKDFFQKHPLINPKTFLGDAAFDSIEIYKYLPIKSSGFSFKIKDFSSFYLR